MLTILPSYILCTIDAEQVNIYCIDGLLYYNQVAIMLHVHCYNMYKCAAML